jgi:LysM domain
MGDSVLIASGWVPPPVQPVISPGPSPTDYGSGGQPAVEEPPEAPSAGTPAPTTPTTPPRAGNGGTHTFNDLTGRDPDLLYAGETIKIEVNGKTINHVVKAGETLSSIAAANGVTVDALIKTNGMDAKLLGKNSAGDYFTSGGPQPAPGGHANPPPEQSVAPLPTSAELEALRSNVQQLDGHGLEPGEAAEMLKLIDKAISDPKQLTSAEIKKLGEYEKTVKAKMKENDDDRAKFNPLVA